MNLSVMKIYNVKSIGVATVTIMTVTCCALMSCSNSKIKSEDKADTELVYEASLLRKGKVTSQITLPGELEGYYETGIMAKVNGYIKRMLVDIGDRVQEGQLLAE